MAKTYEAIATQTLGSAQASVTFSSISSAYTDLRLIINGSESAAVYGALRFNGDTTTNYSSTLLVGSGTAASSLRQSTTDYINLGDADTTRNVVTVDIMNYSNSTTYKTVLTRSNNGSFVEAIVGLWRKAPEVINSITILATSSATYATGSTFTLYGIKAA